MRVAAFRVLLVAVLASGIAMIPSTVGADTGKRDRCGQFVSGVNSYTYGFHSIKVTTYPKACRARHDGYDADQGGFYYEYFLPWTNTPEINVSGATGGALEVTSGPYVAKIFRHDDGHVRKVRYDFVVKSCYGTPCSYELFRLYEEWRGTQLLRESNDDLDTFDPWD